MRTTHITSFGGPEVLITSEFPEPAAQPGRVRVRVLARAVNPVDINTRSGAVAALIPGLTTPAVPGWDFAGELIDPTGELPAGARVLGFVPWFDVPGHGSYTDVVLADPAWLAALSASADPAAAAVVALNASTALLGLRRLRVLAGQNLLVTGASGAVGGAAVQFAAKLGARVLAIASAGDESYVSGLAAGVEVIGGRDPQLILAQLKEFAPDGVDALFDATGQGADLIAGVRDGGALTVVVPPPPEGERGIAPTLTWTGPDPADLAQVGAALVDGTLTPRIAGTYPLERAAEAHARFEEGGLRGKIVLL